MTLRMNSLALGLLVAGGLLLATAKRALLVAAMILIGVLV